MSIQRLRPLEDRGDRLNTLRQALIDGERSGEAVPVDFDQFITQKRCKIGLVQRLIRRRILRSRNLSSIISN